MPSNEIVKTKWGPKKNIFLVGGMFVLVTTVFYGLWLYGGKGPDRQEATLTVVSQSVNQKTVRLKVLQTADEQAQGLGGTDALPPGEGRLFWGDIETGRCFWMKDMKYPLDIIWTDAQKRVSQVEANVAPETYPKTFCGTGQYVIEINAGLAKTHGIKRGVQLRF